MSNRLRQRVFVLPEDGEGKRGPLRPWRPDSEPRATVFHLTPDASGSWRFATLREYVGESCLAEYVTAKTPDDLDRLRLYTRMHRADVAPGLADRLQVLTPDKLGRRIVNLGYRGERGGWPLVGVGLPQLLSAFASSATAARNSGAGRRHDFKLTLPGTEVPSRCRPGRRATSFFRPPVLVEVLGPAVMLAWGTPRDRTSRRWDWNASAGKLVPRRGRFVDLMAATGALCGERPETAEQCCRWLGLPSWPEAEPPDFEATVDLLRSQTAAIGRLRERVWNLLGGLGVAPWKAYSTGSLAAASLGHAGIVPPASNLDPDIPPELLAVAAGAFRSPGPEARATGTMVPAVLVDRSGDFPRAFSALALQALLTADNIGAEVVDPDWLTSEVATYSPDPKVLGLVFALVRPRGEPLPVRVEVAGGDFETVTRPLDFDGAYPVHAFDLATAWARGGTVPEILRAWRFVPRRAPAEGILSETLPLRLPSGRVVDLLSDDLGEAMVSERARIKADETLPHHDRERLVGCLKLFANAMTYGVPARVDRQHLVKPQAVRFLGPAGEVREMETAEPEAPARWSFLPVAAAVTSFSRFMTTRLQARVQDLGGDWVASAVDSLTIIASPDGGEAVTLGRGSTVQALGFDEVGKLLREDDTYLSLSDDSPSLWKPEANSLGEPTFAHCWGTNKVALFRPDENGRFRVVRSCDTALGGHVADPTGSGLDADGYWNWPKPLLEHLVNDDGPADWPAWASFPVVRRLRVVSKVQLRRLREAFPGADVKPWSRYLRAEHERAAYSLDVDAYPRCLDDVTWRRPDGSPVEVRTPGFIDGIFIDAGSTLRVKGRTVLGVETVRERLERWQGGSRTGPAFHANSIRVTAGPDDVELAGKDGALLDLFDADPDAGAKGVLALYGPAVLPVCAVPSCHKPPLRGRGTPGKWCVLHARWSSTKRKWLIEREPVKIPRKALR